MNLLPSPTTLDPTVDASPVNDADLPTLAPDFLASILAQTACHPHW
ncbi:MAG UNVERIFIED_CONTAM: hypothetical protein LVT10_10000 [Anaerolineae bacterium]